MLELPKGKEGVLPARLLREAIDAGVIGSPDEIPEANIQPASLDLRLSSVVHRLQCSFLPNEMTVEEKLRTVDSKRTKFSGRAMVLEPRTAYLIPLKESLALPDGVKAKANPKSSTGRADVFTRVITDHGHRFDEIAAGYHGPLYLEIVPLSFPIVVKEDLTLNQLRLSVGSADVHDDELREIAEDQPLLYRNREPVPAKDLRLANGMLLGLDLRERAVGHRAQRHTPALDMTAGTNDRKYFWDTAETRQPRRLILSPGEFYLLMSLEAVVIPPFLAAEMAAYDPMSGELRTHYAGFFDPGFGFSEDGSRKGSTAALEVRAHDVPFMVEHGQPVCKLTFERMIEEPGQLYGAGHGSNYQGQSETLGKHFNPRTVDEYLRRPPVVDRHQAEFFEDRPG